MVNSKKKKTKKSRIGSIISEVVLYGILPTGVIMVVDCLWGNGFLDKFLMDTTLSLMVVALVAYIPTTAAIVAILSATEEKKGEPIFAITIQGFKLGLQIVCVLCFIHFLSLIPATPQELSWYLFTNGVRLSTFLLVFRALYKVSTFLFGVNHTIYAGLYGKPGTVHGFNVDGKEKDAARVQAQRSSE